MDLFIAGKKVNLVIAVCRISKFTETTEYLQDEIIVFVNKIIKIVHEVAKKWEGAPTKNYGGISNYYKYHFRKVLNYLEIASTPSQF
jgi:hypothetical protein